MSSYSPVDIKNFNIVSSGKKSADMLVCRIFLITPTRVAIKGEKRLFWIIQREIVFLKIFYDICTAKIPSNTNINTDINNVPNISLTLRMIFKNLLNHGFTHSITSKFYGKSLSSTPSYSCSTLNILRMGLNSVCSS